jgi:hypothetical protein
VDSPTCGGPRVPCRSINQTIANAQAKDTIVVGPGRYGDLNGNGVLGEPGEETAQIGFGCFCMIHVDKRVTLVSRAGASATVLDAGGAPVNVVGITASGVVLGRMNQGFLITGGGVNGLGCCFGASNVTVEGNIAVANSGAGLGFGASSGGRLRHNLSIGNTHGFGVDDHGSRVERNLASGNSTHGFVIFGTGQMVSHNVASGNGFGFLIQGTGHTLQRNSAIGNKGFGFQIEPAGGSATITHNNIYGNNDVPVIGLTNCGLWNASAGVITATNNFWGAASGPGADPADEVCNDSASSTIVEPFAVRELPQ